MATTVDHNYGNERQAGIPPMLAVPIIGTVLIKIKDTNAEIIGETTSTPQGIWRQSFQLEDGSYIVEFSGRFRPIGLGFHSAYTKPVSSTTINIAVPLTAIFVPDDPLDVGDGATGPRGPVGLVGPAGVIGPQGATGVVGVTGVPGPIGPAGPAGTGSDGAPGLQGLRGPAGTQGSQGPIGTQGTQGPSGGQGPIGPVGADGSSSDACGIDIGTPTDGYISDGLLDWQITTKVCDALDDINEILAELAPAKPLSLEGESLTMAGVSLFDGNASEKEYQNYKSAAGESIDGTYVGGKIVLSNAFTLTNPTVGDSEAGGDDTFYPGDVGTLSSRITEDGLEAEQGSIDLVTGTPSSNLSLTLNAQNAGYNSFTAWVRGDATIDANTYVSTGYNKIVMRHNFESSNKDSEEYEIFWDDESAVQGVSSATSAAEDTPVYRELSGIRSYTINSTFFLTGTYNNIFSNTYQSNAFTSDDASFPGLTDVVISLSDAAWDGTISSPTPRFDDVAELGGSTNFVITITRVDRRATNARATVLLRKPGRTSLVAIEGSLFRLVDTFSDSSTVLDDPFDDEDYRLPDNDGSAYPNNYDAVPGSLTGNWTSTDDLIDGEATVFHGSLYHGSSSSLPGGGDFTGRLPVGPDYSGFTSDAIYLRAFEDAGDPHNNGILELVGLTASDVSPVGSGNVNVEIKLPTETGWLDMGSIFNVAIFTGADGDGCQTAQSGDDWSFSFGTFSTADSDFTVVVRIIIRNTASVISRIRITDW